MTDKQIIAHDDGEYEPESVRERRASSGRSGSLPGLVGSNCADTVYLISTQTRATSRRYLLGPLIFAYIAAYITTYITFVLYVYDTVHNDIFTGRSEKTFSACNDSTNKSDPEYKMQVRVQQKSSDWSTYYSLAAGIPSIVANVVFGCYTDRFGRRFLLLLPCVGSFLKLAVYSIGVYFKLRLSFFLIGSIIEGMTGQLYTLLIACFTYIADVTPQKGPERSFSIVVIELSIGLASSMFSFASGYFIKYTGYFYPLLTSGALFAVASVIVIFIPESFPKHKRYHGSSALDILRTIYDLFLGDFNWGRRWMYNVLLTVFTLTMFTVFGRSSVEPIYVKDDPFCWSAEKIGYFAALKSAVSQGVGMVAVKLMQKKMSDESIAILGCFSFAVCFLLEGLAFNDITMYMVPIVGIFGMLTIPMCRALLSKLTREDQQGAVFAAIAGMESFINTAGSIAAAQIYANTVAVYRGIVFFVFASTNLVCLVMLGLQVGRMEAMSSPNSTRDRIKCISINASSIPVDANFLSGDLSSLISDECEKSSQ